MSEQQSNVVLLSERDDLDDVVADINAAVRHRGLQMARDLARIVLDAFFDGDLEAYRQRSGQNIYFQRLAERDDLDVSYHQLWTALAVSDQIDLLPDGVGDKLSMSHHRLLLSVRDKDQKLAIAQQAVDESMTRRELKKVLAERRDGRPNKLGRPRLPSFVKATGQLLRTSTEAVEIEVDPEQVQSWGVQRSQELLEALDARLNELRAWRDQIDQAVRSVSVG